MKKNKYISCYHCVSLYGVVDRDCKVCFGTGKIEDTKDAKCNLCNEYLTLEDSIVPQGIYNINVTGGYFSYYLFDDTTYTFSLCEKCIRNMFSNFKIPPKVSDRHGTISYKKEKKRYDYMIWVDNGGASEAYLNGKCNFIKNCKNKAIYSQFISGKFTEKCSCEKHKKLHNYSNSELRQFIPNNLKSFM